MKLGGKLIAITLITLFASLSFAQQTGKIAGTVIDGQNGETVIGANIYLEGTSLGAASDLDGNYVIIGVPVGSYELVVSMIGYSELRIQNVQVEADEINRIDVTLTTEVLQTEVVTVEAEAIKDSEGALLRLRQKAVAVSDAISAEEISKSGSGDAAAAMKKVTGASVVGGKYVYIRGLGDRYSATTLNGAELPSADPDKKSFQLDLIPSNMLDNINTVKTFTPDKPGTFTGGLVDVTLKDYPEQLTLQVSSSLGYNSISTGSDQFILGNSGGTDWLGIDDGERDLPSIFEEGRNTEETPRGINRLYRNDETKDEAISLALLLDEQSSAFSNVMVPSASDAPLNSSLGISMGNTLFLDQNQTNSIGYFGSITWGQKYSLIDAGKVGRYKLAAAFDEAEGLEPEFQGTDTRGSREISWGSIANVAYKNVSLGQIKFSYMHTQSAESQGRILEGFRASDRTAPGSQRTFETSVVSWVERSLDNYQLDGEHLVTPLFGSKLDWKVAYVSNDQVEPDQRYFFNIYDPQSDGSTIYSFDLANSQPVSRYFRDLNETTFSTQINLAIPFKQWAGQSSKIKVGFLATDVERSYNQRRFDYDTSELRLNDFNDGNNLNHDSLFTIVGIRDSVSEDRPGDWFDDGMIVNEFIDSTNFFSGDMQTIAYYAMLDLPLLDRLRFIGGARVEKTDLKSRTKDPEDGQGTLDDTDLLPSVNLIYALHENMNLRMAYSKTIARPTFRELAPYISFEFVGDFALEGNPNLKRTLITNYDLRWEWFMNPGEILAVSGFYKLFKDPIEQFFQPRSGDTGVRKIKNVDEGRVYGIELEIRKSLDFIYEDLKFFKLGTNFSLVNAEVDVPEGDLQGKIDNGESNPDKTRPFPGQSPFLFNANLTYDNFSTKTSAGIFYNVFGDRLFITGLFGTPDVFERGYGTLDFKATQGLGENFAISFTAKNLLNPEQKFSYTLKNDLVDKDFIYQSYKAGVAYSLSLSYKI